jgi:energy-coupling factor transport system permease protein
MSVAEGHFRPGTTVLHRLNPFTKLTIAISFSLACFATDLLWIPLALLLASVLLLSLAGVLFQVGKIVIRYLLFMLVVLFVVQSLWYTGGESPIWMLGPIEIKINGLLFAAMISLRLLVVICSFYLMMFTTHPADLMFNLERRGLSPKIAYVMLATLQSIVELQERAATIMDVQKCRGVEMEGNLFVRAKAYFPLIAPLIIGSVLNIENRALALEVRGFSSGATRTYVRNVEEPGWEVWVRYLLFTLPVLSLLTRWLW